MFWGFSLYSFQLSNKSRIESAKAKRLATDGTRRERGNEIECVFLLRLWQYVKVTQKACLFDFNVWFHTVCLSSLSSRSVLACKKKAKQPEVAKQASYLQLGHRQVPPAVKRTRRTSTQMPYFSIFWYQLRFRQNRSKKRIKIQNQCLWFWTHSLSLFCFLFFAFSA